MGNNNAFKRLSGVMAGVAAFNSKKGPTSFTTTFYDLKPCIVAGIWILLCSKVVTNVSLHKLRTIFNMFKIIITEKNLMIKHKVVSENDHSVNENIYDKVDQGE